MISVGQPYHEGEKLAAVVRWINRNPGIQEVHVSVNDLLQRHNYIAKGRSEGEAGAFAFVEGSLWMARNEDTLSGIKAARTNTRWNDWYSRPNFAAVHQAVADYAQQDASFEEAIACDASSLSAFSCAASM